MELRNALNTQFTIRDLCHRRFTSMRSLTHHSARALGPSGLLLVSIATVPNHEDRNYVGRGNINMLQRRCPSW